MFIIKELGYKITIFFQIKLITLNANLSNQACQDLFLTVPLLKPLLQISLDRYVFPLGPVQQLATHQPILQLPPQQLLLLLQLDQDALVLMRPP